MSVLTQKSHETFEYIGDGFTDKNAIPFYDAKALYGTPNFVKNFLEDNVFEENFYTNIEGESSLLEALSLQAKEQDLAFIQKENILITAGASNAFSSICYALCDKNDVILTLSPSYILFANAPETYGAEMILVESTKQKNKFSVSPKILEEKILDIKHQNRNIKAVLIVNPTNIDGQYWTKTEIHEISKVLHKYDLLVIEDRVYDKLQFDKTDGAPAFFANNGLIKEQVITIDSVSKRYGATQWRVGWLYAPKNIVDIARKFVLQSVWSPAEKYQKATALMLMSQFKVHQTSTAHPRKVEMTNYFSSLNANYQLRRDLCLYIINGERGYHDLSLEVQSLTNIKTLLDFFGTQIDDLDLKNNGIKHIKTPIVPRSAMFMLIEVEKTCLKKYMNLTEKPDLLLARDLYKKANIVVLPPTELTLPEQYPYFRIEYGLPIDTLLKGLRNLQKFMANV